MSQSRQKIFHLELEGEHYYFGSPKAMFDIIGEERLHMKYLSFHSNIRIHPGNTYVNRRHKWIVRCGILGQARTKRGNKWADQIQAGVEKALAAQGTPSPESIVEAVPEPVVEQPIVEAAPMPEPVVEQPIVEAAPMPEPVAEQPVVEAAPVPDASPSAEAVPEPEKPAEKPAPAKPKSRKKKNIDNNPQQLTLF